MASCLVRRSFLTRSVRFPSQASNWRVALTTFIVRHDGGRSLASQPMRDQNQNARFSDNYGDSCRKRPFLRRQITSLPKHGVSVVTHFNLGIVPVSCLF